VIGQDYTDDVPVRRLVAVPASSIRLRGTTWAWDTRAPGQRRAEGRIPAGAVTLGAGRPGIAKSQFLVWLAARITRGELAGCWHGTPRATVLAAAEDSWERTIAPRLVAAGADLDRVFRVDVVDVETPHAMLTLPKDTGQLIELVRDLDVALVGLDPVLSAVDSGLDANKARDVRAALEPLSALADATGVAVFGLAHFTKAAVSDPLNAIAGSGAFGQVIRAAIAFARDEDSGTYVLSQVKNNLGPLDIPSFEYRIADAVVSTEDGPAETSRFEIVGTTDLSVASAMRPISPPDEAHGQDGATDWLLSVLSDGGRDGVPLKSVEAWARDAGIARATLHRAASKAGVAIKRIENQKGRPSVWFHPDSVSLASETKPRETKPQASDQQERGLTLVSSHTPERETKPNEATVCDVCGMALDPVLVESGEHTHPGCAA
jgi:hypothetical protein